MGGRGGDPGLPPPGPAAAEARNQSLLPPRPPRPPNLRPTPALLLLTTWGRSGDPPGRCWSAGAAGAGGGVRWTTAEERSDEDTTDGDMTEPLETVRATGTGGGSVWESRDASGAGASLRDGPGLGPGPGDGGSRDGRRRNARSGVMAREWMLVWTLLRRDDLSGVYGRGTRPEACIEARPDVMPRLPAGLWPRDEATEPAHESSKSITG